MESGISIVGLWEISTGILSLGMSRERFKNLYSQRGLKLGLMIIEYKSSRANGRESGTTDGVIPITMFGGSSALPVLFSRILRNGRYLSTQSSNGVRLTATISRPVFQSKNTILRSA